MGFVSKIKKSRKEGNLFNKMICFILMKFHFSNTKIQALQCRNRTYAYINRKYRKQIEKHLYKNEEKPSVNKNVWLCWLQGIENAPSIVKKCYESIKKNMPDSNIVVITKENLNDYVSFPPYIIEKWEKGIISNAHFSDLLRLELLIKYGGLWIDSTVYLTDKVPEFVFEKNMFLYRGMCYADETFLFNNWFIYSVKDNAYLKTIMDMLLIFWKKENKVRDYFIWHIFAQIISQYYVKEVEEVHNFTDQDAHLLNDDIFKKYDKTYWEQLTKITSIHKLSYKWDIPEDYKDTYYEYIMEGKR